MWWWVTAPAEVDHKKLGDYSTVVTPMSTILSDLRKCRRRGPDVTGPRATRVGFGVVRGVSLANGARSQVRRVPAPSDDMRRPSAPGAVANDAGTLGGSACGSVGEQPCELPVETRWTERGQPVDVHRVVHNIHRARAVVPRRLRRAGADQPAGATVTMIPLRTDVPLSGSRSSWSLSRLLFTPATPAATPILVPATPCPHP